jgi:hypothetical protein
LAASYGLRDLRWCPFNADYFEEFAPTVKALAAADLPAGQSARFLRFVRCRQRQIERRLRNA